MALQTSKTQIKMEEDNMKKLIAILMALALLVCGLTTVAMAEEAEAAVGHKFNDLIEDGEFIIQVDAGDDMGWIADDMAQDSSVVKLVYADTLDGTFVARYAPVGDGDVTVGVRHYAGYACDEMMTWDLHVENGAVTEVTGGSYTASGDEADSDPYLLGEWLEKDTQFTQMTIEKNPEKGWDVEIASPMTHGAYIFKTTIQFDCERNGFVYDKGKFWNVPITDSDEEVELGEAAVAGTTGIFTFVGDPVDVLLEWCDDQNPENTIVFEPFKAEEEAADEAATANDTVYVDPHGDLQFSYDPEAFDIASDEDVEDLHLLVLQGIRAEWDEYAIAFAMRELEDGETAPSLDNPGDFVEDGATLEQGEWNGFENVIMYTTETDDTLQQVFVVPVEDDGEVEDVLAITVTTKKLDDEEAAMAQSDAISAVLDSLVIDD